MVEQSVIQTDRRSGAVVCQPQESHRPKPETIEGLKLRLSELRLAGVTMEEALELCRSLYEEGMQ